TGPSIHQQQGLRSGQQVTVGDYRLVMQRDGNLVEYGPNGAVWSSRTNDPYSFLVMQGDGNLVMYSRSGGYRWSTATQHRGGTEVRLQSDGNLVMYSNSGGVIWKR
ncbi:MAG: hypothetical protein ACK5MT_06335, partial [Actinomycetales bacterium]